MNFFKAQDKARRNTKHLIFLFALAVVCLIALTNILVIGVLSFSVTNDDESFLTILANNYDTKLVIAISIGVSLLITLGSIYKIVSLSNGGQAIAEMLGGTLIPQATNDQEERKLLNIVEEMSIAAGMPIPQVYLLNESSINAFAAGKSHTNAVIGVTRGALSLLSRDELQGVIAHEFSHILNGDMKLNLRLLGVLHGILLIGIIGEHILNSMRYSGGGKKNNGGAILAIGFGLMVIGYTGTFFGKWIKASVSRQREFLADASAVQFTRNKDTIAGALKKIGGLETGSLLENPSASEYSHAYFASGVSSFLESMFATHPPLDDRIKYIDPGWNGHYINPKPKNETQAENIDKKQSSIESLAVTAAILTTADDIVNQVGSLSEDNIHNAQQLLLAIPFMLKEASQSSFSARALIYALLIREQKNKNIAWNLLEKNADNEISEITKQLSNETSELNENLILPLLELCLNTLHQLSLNQYKQFRKTINTIIEADKTIDLNEWVLQRLIIQQLDEHFLLRKPAKEKHALLGNVKNSAEILLSLIAYAEHKDDELQAKQAFEYGKKEIGANAFKMVSKDELSLKALNTSLDDLMMLKPLLKSRILKACAAIIMLDGKRTRKGLELFRTISSNLNCPVPPLSI